MAQPGLPTLNDSRAKRRRQITTGKASIGGISPKLFLGGLAVLIVGGFLYYRNAAAELEVQRARVMAKQRAVAKELTPRLTPMRDAMEGGFLKLAEGGKPTLFKKDGVDFNKLFGRPGVYLRLRLSDARDLKVARKAAQESLRDAFTACLIRDTKAPAPTLGAVCKESKDCEAGELCNEYGACQRPSSPFNARLLYRALSVLSDAWTGEVREAKTDLALVAYDRGLDSVTEVDIPVAIEVYQRAEYALVVLDEDPEAGLPKALGEPGEESEMQRVQRSEHAARVGIWSLPDGELLAMVPATAAGSLRDVGTRASGTTPDAKAAMSRQANSCGMALEVKARLVPTVREEPTGAADSAPSDAPAEPAPSGEATPASSEE